MAAFASTNGLTSAAEHVEVETGKGHDTPGTSSKAGGGAGLGKAAQVSSPCLQALPHGDEATARARRKVEEMRRLGGTEGADTWPRIIVVIGTLGTPPTKGRP